MTRVHLVYPHGQAISCPDAIGRKVAEGLQRKYEVTKYDWTATGVIAPGSDDVLLGHAHPAPWTIFRRSAARRGWKRIVMLQPYHHGDLLQMAWADGVVARSDVFLAITGNYWAESVEGSPFGHWAPRMTQVDLAVDRNDFPAIKDQFNPPGRRRFLYVGHDGWQKNLSYLSRIASLLREDITWIGPGKKRLPGLCPLGLHDFSNELSRDLVAEHDFLVIASLADANPAVVLEAMAWGLIPVCTAESGYSGYDSMVNIPSANADGAAKILSDLQGLGDVELKQMQSRNWDLLESHFSWERLVEQVEVALEGTGSAGMGPRSFGRWVQLRIAQVRSPYFFLRPRQFWPWVARGLGS